MTESDTVRDAASVIIPCRNEERYIAICVESLLEGDDACCIREVLVVDGMSSDGTREVVRKLAQRQDRVRLLDNPERYAPHALNRGIREAQGRFIVRADAHAVYPASYVRELLVHHDDDRVANVGGVLVNRPGDDSLPAEVIAAAMGSPFGVGISFRTLRGGADRDVDTVPFGCWRAGLFREVGLFDERFVRAQDLEFNARCRQLGYRIRCVPSLRIVYHNRTTFAGAFQLARQVGYWKVRVNEHLRMLSSFRQLVPLATFLAICAGAVFAVAAPRHWFFGALPGMIYVAANAAASASAAASAARRQGRFFVLSMGCFAGLHANYAYGYASGIVRRWLGRGSGRDDRETSRQ